MKLDTQYVANKGSEHFMCIMVCTIAISSKSSINQVKILQNSKIDFETFGKKIMKEKIGYKVGSSFRI